MERTPRGDLVFRTEALFNKNIKYKGLLRRAGPAPTASAPCFPSAAFRSSVSPFLCFEKIKPAPVTQLVLQLLPERSVQPRLGRRLLGVELGHLLHVDAYALAVKQQEVDVLQRGCARVVKVG